MGTSRGLGIPADFSRKLRAPKAIGWILIGLGCLFLVSLLVWDARLVLFGVKATGTVLDAPSTGGGKPKYAVRFTLPNGGEATFQTSSTWGSRHQAGEVVPIIYLPGDPSRAEINTLRQLVLPMAIGMIAASLCLAGGVCLLVNFRSAVPAAGTFTARSPEPLPDQKSAAMGTRWNVPGDSRT